MTPASRVDLRVEHRVEALGPEWDRLFGSIPSVQTSREWFAASVEAALPAGSEPHFLAFLDPDGPLVLLPMLDHGDGTFGSLTTPYTCLYQPLLRPGASTASVRQALAEFGHYCRRWPVTRLEALDQASPWVDGLRAGFAAGRLVARTFAHFVNWHATVPAGSWDAYLQARPGALRETVRRKMRAAERDHFRFEVARAGEDLIQSLDAYERVYARSWKEPEPFPAFNASLVRRLAATGWLRIFTLWRADQPVAAQYWTVVGGVATVLKLAHDEAFKAVSPGTILTSYAIRHLIETDGIISLDFGRGDDPYKRAWTGEKRVRIGMLGLDAMTSKGLGVMVRHDAGSACRALLRGHEIVRQGLQQLKSTPR